MEFIYSTDVQVIHAQVELASIGVHQSKRDRAIVELLAFVAYLRTDRSGFENDSAYAKAIGVNKSIVSKALTVIEKGMPHVVARNGRSFATADDGVVATVVAFVDAHNGKAVSGIYSALTGPIGPEEREDKFVLSAALSTVVQAARKREIADSTIVETLLAILAGE